MITSDVVDQACSEVNGYTDERMMKEFDSFFKEQPSICDFITELTSESSMPIQELSLFLSYMVFKTMKLRNPETLPPIPAESIEAAYRQSETWIDRINKTHNYKIISMYKPDMLDEYEKLFRQYKLHPKRLKQSKNGEYISGSWMVTGMEKNHNSFIEKILHDSSVKEFEF